MVSVFVVLGLSCSEACGSSLDQGLNPCPLELVGGFLTTVPPGKSPERYFSKIFYTKCFQ